MLLLPVGSKKLLIVFHRIVVVIFSVLASVRFLTLIRRLYRPLLQGAVSLSCSYTNREGYGKISAMLWRDLRHTVLDL